MKKRKKPFKYSRVNIPMMPETRDKIALEFRMNIETLINAPSLEVYNNACIKLIAFGRAMGNQPFFDEAKKTMTSIFDRHDRVKKIGVNKEEAEILRRVCHEIDAAIPSIPVNVWVYIQLKTQEMIEKELKS